MAFATAEDVAARLGRPVFTGDELAQVNLLLDQVADLILDAVDKTSEWADQQEQLPAAFRWASVEAVARVMLNPSGVRSRSKTLGALSHSESFRDTVGGTLELTDAECRRLRQAVYGSGSGSARVGAIVDDLLDQGMLRPRYDCLAGGGS